MALDVFSARRVFSKDKESAYGTAETLGGTEFLVHFGDAPTMAVPDTIIDDGELYTGYNYLTEIDIERFKVELTHKRKLLPNEAALFFALLLGSVSTTNPTAGVYQHVIEFEDVIDLKSITMWEETADRGQKLFAGIACIAIDLMFPKGKFAEASYQLRGDGSEASGGSLAAKTLINETRYLKYNDLDFKLGGTYSEATGVGSISGGTSKKSLLADIKLAMKNKGEPDYAYGEADGYVSSWRKGGLKARDLAQIGVMLEPDDATDSNKVAAETKECAELALVGPQIGETGYYYTIRALFPVVQPFEASRSRNKQIATCDLAWTALKDTSVNGWPLCQIQVINGQASYLG